MEDQIAVAPEAVAEESAPTFEQASEAALEEHPEESGEVEASPESAPAGEETPKAEAEADHLAWVKSVGGNTNEDGSLNVDRITKQAHELHLQTQKQSQSLKALEESLTHPLIAQAFRDVHMGGDTPAVASKPVEESTEPKTNEEILGEFIDKRTKPQIDELNGTIAFLKTKALNAEYKNVQTQLETEFPNYSEIKDDVGKIIGDISAKAGISSGDLLAQLAFDGSLFETLKSAAINALYPGLKEAKTKAAEAVVVVDGEKQKRARLGLPTGSASQVSKENAPATSWEEALEQAEQELAAAS